MPFENLTPPQAYERMQTQAWRYLDVRTASEFAAGHAKDAVNIPIFFATPTGKEFNADFVANVAQQFAKDTKLVVGCAAGGRSSQACTLLAEHGFTHLANIDGGFSGRPDPTTGTRVKGWKECGLPIDE